MEINFFFQNSYKQNLYFRFFKTKAASSRLSQGE